MRLRDLAGSRVRYGYRRLTVLLRREGWPVNAKRIYRLYREEGLQVRTAKRAKRAAHTRVPLPEPVRANQRWSMDFVSDRFADGKWFRILTGVDQFTRECRCAYADRSQTGEKVVEQMKRLVKLRGAPESITTDNGLNARAFFDRRRSRAAPRNRRYAIDQSHLERTLRSGLPRTEGTPLSIVNTRSAPAAVFTAPKTA